MEDTGAAAEDTAEAPEEAEKERARRLKPEKLEKKFRELQATEEFRHFWKVRKNRGIFCVSSATRSVWHFQNTGDGELNLLFTGDVQPQYMRMIAETMMGGFRFMSITGVSRYTSWYGIPFL